MASHRRTLAAALATAAASLSLYPIFIGWLWFLAGLGSIAVVAAVGTATRVRRLPELACLLSGLVALLLYLNLAFSNARSLWHLLPTPASMRALWHLVSLGFSESSIYAPPVPEKAGMVLLAAGGIGIAALLTDWIAVRLGSAALAGLPLLLLFMEPFTLSIGRGFLVTTVTFCVGVGGYLALLSSEGKDRIREWEHQDPSARDAAPDTGPLAAAGRRVGFASVVLALFLPLVIPGLHVTRLFGGQPGIGGHGGSGGGSGAGVGFPGVDTVLSQQLNSELNSRAADVLEYNTVQGSPDYLQIYVLDQLTDSGWRLFSQAESEVRVDPALPAPPGLGSRAGSPEENETITIASDVGPDDLGALPVPYPAISVRAKGNLQADRSTLMVFDDSALGGLQYSVTSLSVSPTPQALNGALAPPAAISKSYLQVPADYGSLRTLAESVIGKAGAKTQFEKAVALQNWLAEGSFKYTLKAPTVLDASGLTAFLEKTRKGYCQQFSFAMAVLARLVGIPSRVAYGFTSGTPQGSDTWLVTTHDAHAWPELYFTGQGWLRFEPTPSGADGQGTAYAPSYTYLPGSASVGGPANAEPTSAPTGPASGSGSGSNLPPNLRTALDGGGGNLGNNTDGTAGSLVHAPGVNPWEIFGLVLAGLVVIGLAAPWMVRQVIRRRRWRPRRRHGGRDGRGGHDGGQPAGPGRPDVEWAHAAWDELRDDLVDYGAGGRPSESPRTVASRAGSELGLAEPALAALGRIAMAEERARYSARPANGAGLRQDSVTVRRAIAVAVPRPVRWRGRLLPPSVTGPALSATAQAADIFGRLTPDWLGRFRTGTS